MESRSNSLRLFISGGMALFALILHATIGSPASACMWKGDPEVLFNAQEDARPVEIDPGQNPAKIPGGTGYGIAVPGPGEAIPYLIATHGRSLDGVEEVKGFGFMAIIDLGTPVMAAHRHRDEAEAADLRYVNIPTKGDIPTDEEVRFFRDAIITGNNGSIMVYAKSPALLGTMWAAYRVLMGSSRTYAIGEAASLGLRVAPGFTK
ncbi:MAG: hypothetical protein OQJ87_07340 [Rhodospirillales bacterium]|nr:hypothetical protein [Rhodospirillales bacterium]MCW8953192.1 hypothetical protein [Rhodospirillales bacterium]MCW9002519.1 hypothetical protein [Rhodospirillales bacterium]